MIHQLADLFEQGVNLIKENVNYQDPLFQLAIFTIVLSPTFWNVGGRLEYNSRIMRKIFCGNKYLACYVFAFMVFSISGIRNLSFDLALQNQKTVEFPIDRQYVEYIAFALYAVGMTLVMGSFIKLGITGTYCGDYFGILMDDRITSFPFNVLEDPMYIGSTLNFMGQAIYRQSIAGLVLTFIVYVVYMVYSIWLENPYTGWIYAEKKRLEEGKKTNTTKKSKSKKD